MNQNSAVKKQKSTAKNTLANLDDVIASARKTHDEIESHLKAIEIENKKANIEIDMELLEIVEEVDNSLIRLLKATE